MDRQTMRFEYHVLEVITQDTQLRDRFGAELAREQPCLPVLEAIAKEACRKDGALARRKVSHAIENQLPGAPEVLREIAVQNTIDAYTDLTTLLGRRNEPIEYPLPIELNFSRRDDGRYDISIRDYAIGMTLHDLLFRLLAVGDTTKAEKKSQIGGHGRGFKPSIAHADSVTIESSQKKVCVTKETTQGEPRYFIEFGRPSFIADGTKITLEGVAMAQSPLQAVRPYAARLTEEFDFRVNGVRINKMSDPRKIGRLEYAEQHSLPGRGVPLEDTVVACARDVQATEVRQGAMTMFSRPAEQDYARRTVCVPTGVLFPRSRNALPQSIDAVVSQEGHSLFRNFSKFLREKLHRVGAHEFQFLDSFSARNGSWRQKCQALGKVGWKTARYFGLGMALMAFTNVAVIPGVKIAKEYISYWKSSEMYCSRGWTVPKTHMPRVDEREYLLVDPSEYVEDIYDGSPFFERLTRTKFFGRYRFPQGEEDRPVFFRVMGYNTLNDNGSWTNGKDWVGSLQRSSDTDPESELDVSLNLDVRERSILPLPVGYTVSSDRITRPIAARISFSGPGEALPYDLAFIQGYSPDADEGVHLTASRAFETADGLENLFSSVDGSPSWDEIPRPSLTPVNLPFRVEYPAELNQKMEQALRRREARGKEIERLSRERDTLFSTLHTGTMGLFLSLEDDIKKAIARSHASAAEEVRGIFEKYFTYNTSRKNAKKFRKGLREELARGGNLVNYTFRLKEADCDVANAAYCTTLRDRFGLPTRLAIGIQGVEGVLDVRNGHGICEVYIPREGWRGYDATPSRLSKEMFRVRTFSGADEAVSGDGPYTVKIEDLDVKRGLRWGDTLEDFFDSPVGRFMAKLPPETLYTMPLLFIALLAYGYSISREEDLWNIPLADAYSKRKGEVTDGKISLREGIRKLAEQSLWYDRRVSEGGLPALQDGQFDDGTYILDPEFYSLILEKSGGRRRAVTNISLDPVARTTSENPLAYLGFASALGGQQQRACLPREQSRLETVQGIADMIARANDYRIPKVAGDRRFADGRKLFAQKGRRVYINLEHEKIQQEPATLETDPVLIDTLVYALMLSANAPLSGFRTAKERFLTAYCLEK